MPQTDKYANHRTVYQTKPIRTAPSTRKIIVRTSAYGRPGVVTKLEKSDEQRRSH